MKERHQLHIFCDLTSANLNESKEVVKSLLNATNEFSNTYFTFKSNQTDDFQVFCNENLEVSSFKIIGKKDAVPTINTESTIIVSSENYKSLKELLKVKGNGVYCASANITLNIKDKLGALLTGTSKELANSAFYFKEVNLPSDLNTFGFSNYSLLVSNICYSLNRENIEIEHLECSKIQLTESKQGFFNRVTNFINWYITSPINGLKEKNYSSLNRLIFFVFTIVSLFLMTSLSFDFGISGDEKVHRNQARFVIDYFENGDEKALDQPKTLLHFYGQSFDLFTEYVVKWFGLEESLYDVRHFFNSIFGFLLILFIGLCARVIAGYNGALIAMFLALISPRLFGHSMNNPMDIPFATGYAMAAYYLVKIGKNYSKINYHDFLLLSLAIALTISIRVGGILLVPISIMHIGLVIIEKQGLSNVLKFKLSKSDFEIITLTIATIVLGYFIGLIPWPYALQAPLSNPFTALSELSNISVSINQIFEGETVMSNKLPWNYLPKFMLITIPEVILVGIFLYIFKQIANLKSITANRFLMIFMFIFPIVYVIYKKSNLYGGWRHMMFVYPTAVVLAGLFWNDLISAKNKILKMSSLVIFLGLSGIVVAWMFVNHPHQYVYFNHAFGGVEEAYKKYEIDYYSRSLKEEAEWLIENENFKNRTDTIIIASNHTKGTHYYFKDYPNVKLKYTRYYEKNTKDWDYAIWSNIYIDPHQLKHNLFPPAGAIHSVEIEDVPLSTVVKRVSKDAFLANQAFRKRNYSEAERLYTNYLKLDPNNEEALLGVANAYSALGKNNEAIQYAKKALEVYPTYVQAYDVIGRSHMNNKNYNTAINSFSELVKIRQYDPSAYYYLGVCYYSIGNFDAAIQMGKNVIQINNRMKQAYGLIAEAYKQKGDVKSANSYISQMKKIK